MIYRYDPRRADRADVPIGRPAANTQIYVLDKNLEPVPENVAGDLYISGDGLALGYLDNPVLTAEKFIPNPFLEGRRMYKSGDLARRLNNGEIEFIGRQDEQIKFHGHRVELNEIRNAINSYPDVEESALTLIKDEQGSQFMVLYYVSRKELDRRELRDYLKTQMMEEIIPSFYVRLDELPLTVNGKVDYAALPSFKETQNVREVEQDEERTPVEELVSGIWQEMLGLEQVGLDEDFFELGGHSLLATQVVSRIKAAFGVSIGLRSIFKASTVRRMAKRVEECLRKGEQDEAPPIIRVPRDVALPLSFAQQRLWLINQLDEGGAAYNAFTGLRLKGELRKGALDAALSRVVARHEVLRTSFPVVNHNPVQLIHPAQPFHLSLADLSLLDAESRSREVLRLANEEARRPFDLTNGPLLRGLLIKEQAQEHAVLFTLHHIVSDGWSVGVVVRELSRAYDAQVRGEEIETEELEIQYADYAVWQREWLAGEELERQVSYWKEQLAGAPAFLDLPLDKPRSSLTEYKGAGKAFMVPPHVLMALKELSRKEQVTLFMTLLAAFDILLMRYTGQDDIVVGSNIANRNRKEIEGLIGFFVNNLVLRTDLSGDPTFSELLHRVREVCLGAYTHQDLPFELVVEAVQPERDSRSTPLFQVMFVIQNAPSEALQLPGLTVAPLPIKGGTARFDLMMNLRETPHGLHGTLEFSTDIFYPETIENMVEQFSTLLADIATDPDREISLLSVVRDEETERLGDRFYQDVLAALGSGSI
jgi:acyl carrier protein